MNHANNYSDSCILHVITENLFTFTVKLFPMIEQTELVITEWIYRPPKDRETGGEKIITYLDFDVMKKRVSTKKGIACRFTCHFVMGQEMILSYIAEDSYVIDIEDVIDRNELFTMIRNSYSKFNEKFEFKKLDTILHSNFMIPLDESKIDVDALLPLLK